ncbi:uncharacterized protein LOC124417573 isoform X3 [Gallus gallus]|uniref:uncharacterized protein LOC124417573 isoform X3 n=1 Tax=Gallus gallus TaxID=9031 RepID=UPI001F027911|nr:uncharacterized protein LOC124417573 isoform X3 [Gallus gallus]
MVSGSSVPPPVASPRMRAAPRRKRGRTGAVLRTAAPEGQEPGSGTAARLAALQLSWEVEDVAVKEESLTGPPSPSQDPHSPLMRNLAAIHISGWASSCAPMPSLKTGE